MNRRMKSLFSLIFTFLIVVMTASLAFASTESKFKTVTVIGYTYDFNSSAINRYFSTGNTIEACTSIFANTNAPSGYMGIQARLYNSNGSLYTSSSWKYNTESLSAFEVYSSRSTTKGNYYSFGRVQLYNGNGYNSYDAYQSPIATLSLLPTTYKVNENGETYGKGATGLGKDPDLIEAVGVDGTLGYVRSSDLDSNFKTPEDAIAHNPENNSSRLIPLYDKNGNEIGDFELKTTYKE